MEYDFSGYATRYDIRCSDGRIIRPGAFDENLGKTVPLVWDHRKDSPENILGHALLEGRPDGVYVYGNFNDSPLGVLSKSLVKHKDINSLSIHANQLVENNKNVMRGNLREVSLVVAGANPGAFIDNIVIEHSDGDTILDDEAIIYSGDEIEHTDDKEEPMDDEAPSEMTVGQVFETMTEEQKNVVYYMLEEALKHGDTDEVTEEVTEEITKDDNLDGTDVPPVDNAGPDGKKTDEKLQHNQEGTSMTVHNIFDQTNKGKAPAPSLTHSDVNSIFEQARKLGSFREAVDAYALSHGIEDIGVLFPDAQSVTNTPDFVKRRTEWVADVMSGTRHTPFSRIKSVTADLTLDEARARGYVKGNMKREEFFSVAKRVTTPQTIYKKQKLDRDDVVDITEFDVVVWLREEMRVMLDEEIARAILIGDGRSNADDDKIKEDNIRPIATDSELYTTTVYVNLGDAASSPEEIVDALTLHRRHYRGSGNPSFYTSETILAQLLLTKDDIGRRLYPTINDLAAALRVNRIVAVEVMENQGDLIGILVNLADYTIGSDRGGAVSMFDDFDIDYNKLKYLIETRISGALTKPKSALVVRKTAAAAVLVMPTAPSFVEATGVVTVPTVTGVTYKNKLTDATLTTAAPVTLAPGDTLTVIAVPASASYYFSTNADDEWYFEAEV